MADHGTVEYATATGNDYPAHENSYERFMHFTVVGILYVITVLFGLATGGVMGHWLLAAAIFVIGLVGAVFLHLAAELNFYRLFNEAIEKFSVREVAARQTAALAEVGLKPSAG